MPNSPRRIRLLQSLQYVSDRYEVEFAGADVYFARSRTNTLAIKTGLRTPLGVDEFSTHVSGGRVDEYEVRGSPDEVTTVVRGRDAAALAHDTVLYITYGAVQDPTEVEPAVAPPPGVAPIPGVTQRLVLYGRWTAAAIASDLAARAGLELSWQAPDYTVVGDFEVSGRVFNAVQQLASPFSQFEPYRVDIFAEGLTLVVRQRPGVSNPPTGPLATAYTVAALALARRDVGQLDSHVGNAQAYTVSMKDARVLQWMVRARYLDYIRVVRVYGAVQSTAGNSFFIGGKTDVKLEEIDVDNRGPDGVGQVVHKTVRHPDEATIHKETQTYGPNPNEPTSVVQLDDEVVDNDWDTPEIIGNTIINQVHQRKSVATVSQFNTADGVFRPVSRHTTTWMYDASEGFMNGQETLVETYNKDTASFDESEKEVRALEDNGIRKWEETVDSYRAVDVEGGGKAWSHQSRTSNPGGGYRPDGKGRGLFISASLSDPLKNQTFIGALVDDQPGAVDVEVNDKNLLYDDAAFIIGQARASSGATEYELNFTGANIPWMRKGSLLHVTGVEDAEGTPIGTETALVFDVSVDYAEDGDQPTSLQTVKAVWWRRD